MGFTPALKAFYRGGARRYRQYPRSVLGGLLLGVVENLGLPAPNRSWRDVIAFGHLVLVLLVRDRPSSERLGRSA